MEKNDIIKNDIESVNYRRNLNILVVLGTGVMMFGAWGVIKLIAQVLLGYSIYDPAELEELGPIGSLLFYFIMAFILSLDVILRLYAGLRARREGHGKKTGAGHLVVSVILILGSIISIIAVIWNIMTLTGEQDENFIGLFMELSSLVVTLEVFIASISVRRYRKKYPGEAAQRAG